jgi:large subunit ribosomal protein L25
VRATIAEGGRYHQPSPMASTATKLTLTPREPVNSRATRRLRREGNVPGILYGGGEEPVAFLVEERELRHALAARGAVLELTIDGTTTPAVLKDAQRHPVRGETLHVDFLRVRLDVAIQSTVGLELEGGDHAPGVIEGGVLEHVTREITVEALPGDIPEMIHHDVSQMQINETLTLAAVTAPKGVTLIDDVEETVIATLVPPTVDVEAEEEALEEETERVGEGVGEAEGTEADADAGDVPADAGDAQTE